MKEYWVYELRAGSWFYIGMTSSNLKQRLSQHRCAIRKHLEKPRPKNWHQAIQDHPLPESWNIHPISGPYESKEEASAEEERLHKQYWDCPGRLWEKCGHKLSEDHISKVRESKIGRPLSDEHKEKLRLACSGWAQTEEAKDKIRAAISGDKHPRGMKGKKLSPEHIRALQEGRERRRRESVS